MKFLSLPLLLCLFVTLASRRTAGAKECYDIGVADRNVIPDKNFESSTFYSYSYVASFGRLNSKQEGWAPKSADMLAGTAYLQIDLGAVYTLCSIKTQGNGGGLSEWTKTYKVLTRYSPFDPWFYYQEVQGTDKEFRGNTDSSSVVTNYFKRPVSARFVKFLPTSWSSYPTTRLAIYKSECSDTDPECQSLALQGKCTDRRTYGKMMTKCCQWCKLSKELVQDNTLFCIDQEPSCEAQAARGQCFINAARMLRKCCAACKKKGFQAKY